MPEAARRRGVRGPVPTARLQPSARAISRQSWRYELGRDSFDPQLGYLFANINELGQLSGLRDHDPKERPGYAEWTGQPRRSRWAVRRSPWRRTV